MWMRRSPCLCAIFALCYMAQSGPIGAQQVPSGQEITLHEVLIDNLNTESWLRFRFVTPQIARAGGDISYAEAEADIADLCTTFVLPYMAQYELQSDVVVISFSDQKTEFGETNQDATQFYEAFRVENGTCIWEAF